MKPRTSYNNYLQDYKVKPGLKSKKKPASKYRKSNLVDKKIGLMITKSQIRKNQVKRALTQADHYI